MIGHHFAWVFTLPFHGLLIPSVLHGPSMFAVKVKIYGVLYKQSSSIAYDETSTFWSAPKNT